ncbi:bifunctional 4-hydroxy-2-oxoglutarate aldolase/2-dehydro-3-deoxy-phosphogluconate aldolase [candidate division KSB1 bacterium]|nr:bifunctional 4-hydroxy-2-oxoglutarate aldolase/2-dehydro-3-deoxy-phosphogluconate aldolase [candidate division KSB1 bacterium]
MQNVLEELGLLRIIPIVSIQNAIHTRPLAEALIKGGLPCAEITFRTEAALDAIHAVAEMQDLLVGAGTVLKVDQVKAAVDAGARFIVSPGFNPKVVDYCVKNEITVTPGVCTPTDIEMAMDFGLKVVKFFPAEAFGGLKTLKALSGPYHMMKFIPTGGVNIHNLREYLAFPKVFACGGSWMVKSELISAAKFAEITELTAEAVKVATQTG